METNEQLRSVIVAISRILREYLISGKNSMMIIETKHSKCHVKHIDGENINKVEVS